jgi:hypothetical protein
MADGDQQNSGTEPLQDQGGEQDWMRAYMGEAQSVSAAGIRRTPKKKSGNLVIILAVVLAAGVAAVFLMKSPTATQASSDSDDLGAGVSTASGLRGHLVTRWQKGKAQYQLKIEPIDPRSADEFAQVAGNPRGPIAINVRVLDSSGFALCGKEILLPNGGGLAAKPAGADAFTNILDSDGKVEALWSQGELPCSPDQYKHFDYWDLTTNFPTLAEQDGVQNHGKKETEKERTVAETPRSESHKAPKKVAPTFYVQGDDWITGFEASRDLLIAGPGRSFFLQRKSDEAIVAGWAADDSLIHFKCDQHAACALNRAGSSVSIPAKLNE